jgi:hypothetical protein
MQRFNGLDFRNVRDAIAGAPRFLDAPGSLRANDISSSGTVKNASRATSTRIAGLFLVCDRRLGTFVEPSPIGLVAFALTFVNFAALGRTKLLEVPAASD